jgi:hypothetical protein
MRKLHSTKMVDAPGSTKGVQSKKKKTKFLLCNEINEV